MRLSVVAFVLSLCIFNPCFSQSKKEVKKNGIKSCAEADLVDGKTIPNKKTVFDKNGESTEVTEFTKEGALKIIHKYKFNKDSDQIEEEELELPADKPLTLAAYDAGPEYVAYVEFVGVGDELPEMPLFLKPGIYVPTPLETTYQSAWSVFPDPLKGLLDSPGKGK